MLQEILSDIDLQFVAYVGAVVGGLLILEGLRQMIMGRGRREKARSRRMKMIHTGASTEEILAVLKPEEKRTFMNRLPLVGDFPTILRQAGIYMSSGAFLTTCFAGFVAASVLFSQLMSVSGALILGFSLCFLVPIMAVRIQRTQRVNDFVKQLPDALDMMARGLKVGHPINASVKTVADEMPDPIGTEFGIVVDQVSYGDDLTDAFNELADRIDQEDLHYLATAIGIQHGTGGDLARILNVLATVIRDRMTMRRKIKAVSAEGRLSGAILSVVPVLIFAGLNTMAPGYYGDVADEPLAKPLAFIVVFLIILNAVVLRKLVTFRF